MAEKAQGHIFYAGPMYWDKITSHGGLLPGGDMLYHSFAAWHLVKCCHLALLEIPGQATLTTEKDLTVNLRKILDSTRDIYGMFDESDLEKIMNLMPLCRQLTFKLNRTWNDRFQAWLDSGGRAYDEVTREPDAI